MAQKIPTVDGRLEFYKLFAFDVNETIKFISKSIIYTFTIDVNKFLQNNFGLF